MTRPSQPCRVLAVALVATTLVAGGCNADPQPTEPAPTPQPRYEQPPTDLCEPMRIDELLHRHDLSVPPGSSFPSSYYDSAPSSWYARCSITGWAGDGRFETEIGEFVPGGAVTLRVYHDVEDAVQGYELDAHNYFERPVERDPGAVTGEPAGWWGTGRSLTLVEELDPDDSGRDYSEIVSLNTRLLVRHENLVALGYLRALSPTEQVEEVTELLHELLDGLLDEAVEQLTLTTG